MLDASTLKKFQCRRCQECCRQPGFVSLTPADAGAASQFLHLSIYEFTDQFCEFLDRDRLVLKKKDGEACVFLEKDGCRIHPSKPEQCRDFPVKWRTAASLDYCAGLRALNLSLPKGNEER